MKTITKVIFNLVLFAGLQASAIVIPGWKRPILQVNEVSVFAATGELSQVTDVTMAMNENPAYPSGRELVVNVAGEVVKMWISNIKPDSCGSVSMSVLEQESKALDNSFVISVVDHSTRSCKDLPSHVWDVEINLVNSHGEVVGSLTVGANPETVYTIQGGKEFQTQVEPRFKAAFNN